MIIFSLMIMIMMMTDNGDKDKFMMMSAVPKGRSEEMNPPSRE